MARIRTIKPEFPQSESMGRVSRDARLLFILLWTLADDSGRARASSRMLASLLFPYDDGDDGHPKTTGKDVERWLEELAHQGCVELYEIDGTHYVQISKWLDHQKIDHPTASRLPSPREASRENPEKSVEFAPDLGPSTKDQDISPKPKISLVQRKLIDDGFDDWYAAYPRHVARGAAEKAYRAALKCSDPNTLLSAVRKFAAKRVGQDQQFTPYPATWLNSKSWLDEDVTETSGSEAVPTKFEDTDEIGWQKRVNLWKDKGMWSSGWGPKPGEQGCRAPRELLEAA